MLERPLIPTATDYYTLFNVAVNTACSFLIPWFLCETVFGQLVSWLCMFVTMIIGVHRHYEWSVDYKVLPVYMCVCAGISVMITLDLP